MIDSYRFAVLVFSALFVFGCDVEESGESYAHFYASEVIEFMPGEGASFGQDRMPDVVLGAPSGTATAGSLDVLSLGVGGEIILGFGEQWISDGEGSDFIVYENAFWVAGDPENIWSEPAEISVSPDGEVWHTFSCDPGETLGDSPGGCAGITPTFDHDPASLETLEPGVTGGDAYDLADLGLETARYVRIRDLSEEGASPSAGFDLDAVGLIHWATE